MLSQESIHDDGYLEKLVEEFNLPGAVGAFKKSGKLILQASGFQDVQNKISMKKDSIVRIASMTKPITVLAILKLITEGKLTLTTKLVEIFPKYRKLKLAEINGDQLEFKEIPNEITIKHLLLSNAGFTQSMYHMGDPLGKYLMAINHRSEETYEKSLDKLFENPLAFETGVKWNYSLSYDILGFVVRKISGMDLETYFQQNFFIPLGMNDTSFHVPEDKLHRLAYVYQRPDAKGEYTVYEDNIETIYANPNRLGFGGSGLVSTMEDFAKILDFILDDGKIDGTQVILPELVQEMYHNNLPEHSVPITIGAYEKKGIGWGFGVAVKYDDIHELFTPPKGMFYWMGAYNSIFAVNPKTKEYAIFASQMIVPNPMINFPIVCGYVNNYLSE